MIKKLTAFVRNETVLSISLLLALVSSFIVLPDREYLSYVDVRTLAILFCLMAVMAGLQSLGMFRWVAQKLLARVRKPLELVLILVLLCFFFSMVITNDVALITFVPFTFTVLRLLGEEQENRLVVPTVVLQTVAANLGSMLTPIGNPQNLYLFGRSGMGAGEFLLLMLPYSLASLVLLVFWCLCLGRRFSPAGVAGMAGNVGTAGECADGSFAIECADGSFVGERADGRFAEECAGGRFAEECMDRIFTGECADSSFAGIAQQDTEDIRGKGRMLVFYGVLFFLCILTVARILPYWLTLILVASGIGIADRRILRQVDYSLLLTFVGFFIFIGNMGRVPAFRGFLEGIIAGHEVFTGVAASQVISNVPAALLLSGFTQDTRALIIGTNLGGLGTLIASMASLISFKYIGREKKSFRGPYILYFTAANICFLVALALLFVVIYQ